MGRILTPTGRCALLATGAVGGFEERRGPHGERFDFCSPDDRFGMPSFEQAEGEMARMALSFALGRAGVDRPDLLLSGDLQNQCVASSQGPAAIGAPFLGLFGACSTMVEGIGIGMLALSGSAALQTVAAVTSSHNAAAERQFRTPLEYGAQRTPTAQWTATAAGAVLLGRVGEVCIGEFLPGRVVDAKITDAANMGAAMAPAAADTLLAYFEESGAAPCDFDVILTGDLGREGSALLQVLLSGRLAGFAERHRDCGCMLYDPNTQDVHAGGSGCGCIAAMLAACLLPDMAEGKIRRMLAVGTGALMNPGSIQQGGSIAGVAHLVSFRRDQ